MKVEYVDGPPSPQFLIAASRRILANEGCFSFAQGHVSYRDEEGESFWMTPWGYQDETLPSDVIRLGMGLEKVEGTLEASAAAEFHAAIYSARSDVRSVIHLHSHWGQVLSTMGRLVDYWVGEASFLYGQQAFCDIDEGFVGANALAIAESLGHSNVLIMKNHGSITTGTSIEEATVRSLMFEYCARLQIEAELVGGKPMEPSDAYVSRFPEHVGPQIWAACYRRLKKTDPDLIAAADPADYRSVIA